MSDRYQNQSPIVRLWRSRHYLSAPLHWLLLVLNTPDQDLPPGLHKWAVAWAIAVGSAQSRMQYFYTWEEVQNLVDDQSSR